jgi:hypothetical protein
MTFMLSVIMLNIFVLSAVAPVQQSPNYPKIKGSNPAADTGKE